MRAVIATLIALASFATGLLLATLAHAQTPVAPIVGAWTLDKDLSDPPRDAGQRDDGAGRGERGRRGGRGGYRGGFGGGGFGGRGGGGGRDDARPEDRARRLEAMRDIMDAPEHLTITATESMVIVTSGDGRTTRLSLDGKKVKDDSTGIERKTKWDGPKLVTEITGAGPGTITQTYEVDPEHHRLTITIQPPNFRGAAPPPRHHVYDADASPTK